MSYQESVSVIVPTLNEAENIAGVIKRTKDALGPFGIKYEILVVDDASSDGTADVAKRFLGDRGRVISRVSGPRGLSLSVLDGIRESKGEVIVVMDGDGSHPPELIPSFINYLNMGYDLLIGSRYVAGGSTENFPLSRIIISRFACLLGRIVTPVKDNTSGFFCLRKSYLNGVTLTPRGFKIGLEVFVKTKITKIKEIPYIFANRQKGESKLKMNTAWQYLCQIKDLLKFRLSHA